MLLHITYAIYYLKRRYVSRVYFEQLRSSCCSVVRASGCLSSGLSPAGQHPVYAIVYRTKKMAASIMTTFTHSVISGLYVFTVYYAFFVMHIPFMQERFKKFDVGQLKYLTIWNLLIQTFFSMVCLLNDLIGSNKDDEKQKPWIRRFKDFLHASIGFPLSMFVGVTFWALMAVDRELVLPKALDPYFPGWLNHLMHTLIMFTTLLEMIISSRLYPTRSQGIKALITFMLTYLCWMHYVYYRSGVWAYPVIEVLSWPLRIVFYAILLLLVIGLYFVGEKLNGLIWGDNKKAIGAKKKK
ncbi:hypothetical protein TKK_0012589 [Trichogramma kaykai]|uniref:Androgen-dependent TFPI-regulating protein n=1 Tax=Trichogramma kaykai TaxID=54128 RepID=A0ABD2WLR6_9HYME